MRYREIITEDVGDGHTFYHVTTKNRLKSIMATGLEPRRHRRYRNQLGGMLGERGFIYLISDYKQAVVYATRQAYQYCLKKSSMETVILVLQNVPTKGLLRDDHPDGKLAGHTWYKSPATIAPQDIVQVIPLTPELSQQAIPDAPEDAESVPEGSG